MDKQQHETILKLTGASELGETAVLQNLWSGYGEIVRVGLTGGTRESVVVKHIRYPQDAGSGHPRGWNTDRSHMRKLRSYQVETAWYQDFSSACPPESCRVPECLGAQIDGSSDEGLIVLEDLDAAGYPQRKNQVDAAAFTACIDWLASFHAQFLGVAPEGLWETGTYWHLETRPDEWATLDDADPIKAAAKPLDQLLSASPYQTLVHGDAKLANFCFSADGSEVAAVDFQYVGGGCGMKDLAYFVGSCLHEEECAAQEEAILARYFTTLSKRLSAVDALAVEADWRALYPVAWTDFHRFLKGWSPGHWKLNSYSERVAREVINNGFS